MRSVIYFLQAGDDGPIKIGYTSRRSEIRRQCCQTYNSEPIRLLAEAGGERDLEDRLHDYLEKYRIRGEWFENCPQVQEIVQAIDEGLMLRDVLDMANP